MLSKIGFDTNSTDGHDDDAKTSDVQEIKKLCKELAEKDAEVIALRA